MFFIVNCINVRLSQFIKRRVSQSQSVRSQILMTTTPNFKICQVIWRLLSVIYFRYKGTVIGNQFGPGNGTIWLDNVHCVGNEMSIIDCHHNGWGTHNCEHDQDVSVTCGTSPVQLGIHLVFVLLRNLARTQNTKINSAN